MDGSRRVLCVDDNADNLEVLQAFFEAAGYVVTPCPTAAECLEMLGNDRFDAIVLDLFMPEMDGLELFREIRSSGFAMPVVVYTADSRPGTRELMLEAGVDAFLVKPDGLSRVVRVVTHLIESFNRW
jgi:CheY-like chemotaxis protein